MAGTKSPCILCHSTTEDASGMKLYSNCNLLDGEACNACKDYVALEDKISATKQLLDKLLSQRTEIRTRVNQNHDLLTTSVPLEIMCSIFKFCVPAKSTFHALNYSDPFSRDKQMVSAPLLLGSICRTWRNIAWAVKPLWTLFRLNLNLKILQNTNNVALAKEWLDRAGQLPLSIRITCDIYRIDQVEPPEFGVAAQLLTLINERSERWETLDIEENAGWTSEVTGGSGGAPNLQVLKLRNLSVINSGGFVLAGPKPQPSHLFLRRCTLHTFDIEWNSLTNICVLEMPLKMCIELLRRAPNLADCIFSSIFETDGSPNSDQPTVYPALESLEFGALVDTPRRETVTFFKNYMFPNLKHLKLKNGLVPARHTRNNTSWDPVFEHIMVSCPSMTSLGILLHWSRNLHPISQCIIPILQRTPMLRNLEVFAPHDEEWDDGQNELFKLLADTSNLADDGDGTQPTFLPNLRSIEFRLTVNVDPEKFWNSISGIFGPITDIHNPRRRPLKTLRVRDRVDMIKSGQIGIESKDAVLQLLRLQQEGIVVDLETTDGIHMMDLLQRSTELHDPL